MKENIYTIPVTEAFENGGECPFCGLFETLTADAVNFMLSDAYMQDHIRMETNKTGFCKHHLETLFAQKNRLGLSLIMYTHMRDVNAEVKSLLTDMLAAKTGFFKKSNEKRSAKTVSRINELEKSCYVCDRINGFFTRYVDTYFFLWKKDDDIKNLTKKTNGFCLNHYADLLEAGEEALSPAEFGEFLNITVPMQIDAFAALEADLDWFIKKYDYRFVNEPWKNSKDALGRALKKMQSINVKE